MIYEAELKQVTTAIAAIKRTLEGHKHVLNLVNESFMFLERAVTEWVD